jgi:transposase
MRRFAKVEKILIATATANLTTYDCKQHGILQLAVKSETAVCPWCKQSLQQVQGVEDLKRQYRKELRLDE